MLNKEFKRKDVERIRNLVKGKVGESSELQVGYTTKKEDHKEGDIWEEGGKKWTIKDGIKQTATKLDEVKKEAILPLFCPSCKSLMKKRNDTKMYNIHKMCYDCVIDMEHKLKIKGKYEEYEQKKIRENAEAWLKRAEQDVEMLKEVYTQASSTVMNADGMVEHWSAKMTPDEFEKTIQTQFDNFKIKFLKNLETKKENND